MNRVPIIPGTRVLVRHKHAHSEGAGRWGIVRERHGKTVLVVYDAAKRARQEHVANIVARVSPIFSTEELRAVRAHIMGDNCSIGDLDHAMARIASLLTDNSGGVT